MKEQLISAKQVTELFGYHPSSLINLKNRGLPEPAIKPANNATGRQLWKLSEVMQFKNRFDAAKRRESGEQLFDIDTYLKFITRSKKINAQRLEHQLHLAKTASLQTVKIDCDDDLNIKIINRR